MNVVPYKSATIVGLPTDMKRCQCLVEGLNKGSILPFKPLLGGQCSEFLVLNFEGCVNQM